MAIKSRSRIKKISFSLFLLTVLYLLLRIVFILATTHFGYVIYVRSLDLNIKALLHYADLPVICFSIITSSLAFKNKMIPVLLMFFIVVFLPFHFLFKLGIENVTAIKDQDLTGNYAVELSHTPVNRNDISLSAFVYKEKYPSIYEEVGRKIEVFSDLTDEETIKLYRGNMYEVSSDGKKLEYGKFIIPIK